MKSARTVCNYINGVRSFLKHNRKSTACLDSYHIDLMLQACKLSLNFPSRKKESVTFNEFKSICKACDSMGAKGTLLKVSVTMCFYGMLRQSNICPRTSKSFNHNKNTSRDCIEFQQPGLHSSKILTIQQGITRVLGELVPLENLVDQNTDFLGQNARVMHRYFKSMFFVLRSDSGYIVVELTIPCWPPRRHGPDWDILAVTVR